IQQPHPVLLRIGIGIVTGIMPEAASRLVQPADTSIPRRHPDITPRIANYTRDEIPAHTPAVCSIMRVDRISIRRSAPVPQAASIRSYPDIVIRILAERKDEVIVGTGS